MFEQDIFEFDNQLRRLNIEFESICSQQALNLRRIQNKIILENASPKDATVLYFAEAKESGKKKQNIFVRLIEKIKAFIIKILNKITGGKFEPKRDKKIPGNPQELMKYGKELLSKAKTAINSKGAKTTAKIGAGVGAIGGAAFILKKAKQGPTLSEISSYLKSTNVQLKYFEDIANDTSGKYLEGEQEVARAYISEFGKVTSRLGKIVAAIKTGDSGELVNGSKYEADKLKDDTVLINGMSKKELLDERERILKKIIDLKKSNTPINRFRQAREANADKSGFAGGYIETRKELNTEKIATLQKQLSRCDELIKASAKSHAEDDHEFLNKQK